jgi:hypothetical protein
LNRRSLRITAAPINDDPQWERLPVLNRHPDTAIEEGTATGYAYNAARMYAAAAAVILDTSKSPDAVKHACAESDRAMAILRDAVANGFCDVARMKSDGHLDVLRERDDFQALIAELESKTRR